MSLDSNAILVENLRASLDSYQQSLVWAMTASATFFVLTLNLRDSKKPSVKVFSGELSRPAAWSIALGLVFVLGVLAESALENVEAILSRLKVESEVLDATLLYPSFATSHYGLIRVGTVLFVRLPCGSL